VAKIPQALRDELETAGETVIANALAVPMDVPGSPFHKFRFGEERATAETWLIERRDIAERKEQRAERWVGIGAFAAIVAAGAAVLLLIWQNQRWNSEDRPELIMSHFTIPPALDKYQWDFTNRGKDDATHITIKLGKTDLYRTRMTLLTKAHDASLRLKHGMIYTVTTSPDNDQEFLVVCMNYRNERGTVFDDPPKFYLTPYMGANHETTIFSPSPVTALQDSKLSAGFSCTNL
jgi:hypothetical protein